MPSLIVLDGFDEVGATQDRDAIIFAARELLIRLAEHGALSQVVATTRPQGYAGELSRIGLCFKTRYLAPLLRQEALGYAEKLVEAKISGADQRKKTLARLIEAAAEPATQRLLTTPLQVTILTALVQQLGRAPRERWNLFYKYFSYTYDREIERDTYASGLLADHRSHIERIHARVALLLQVEAERVGGASARMSRARLEEVIESVLSEDEVSADLRMELVRDIATAAEQRLVFLVEPEPGGFGFEIRSLQEFMAAWALTSGRDIEVEARLQQVAKSPLFRNVMLFAASRLFSDGSPLREIFAERFCGGLEDNPEDEVAHLTRAGSLLALETLEEGAVLSQPKRARALMKRAVGLFSLPPGNEHTRIARVANNDTITILEESLAQELSEPPVEFRHNSISALICILELLNLGHTSALILAENAWDSLIDIDDFLKEIERLNIILGPWIIKKIENNAERIAPEQFIDLTSHEPEPGIPKNWVQWLQRAIRLSQSWTLRQSKALVPLLPSPKSLKGFELPCYDPPKAWVPWIEFAKFQINPTGMQLARALEYIADGLSPSRWGEIEKNGAWPISACLGSTERPEDLRRYARDVYDKRFGDILDWRHAETVWIARHDLFSALDETFIEQPWNISSISKAPPFYAIYPWIIVRQNLARERISSSENLLRKAKASFATVTSSKQKSRLGSLCLSLGSKEIKRNSRMHKLFLEWALADPGGICRLIPRPQFITIPEWLKLLENFKPSNSTPWICDLSAAMNALLDSHGHQSIFYIAGTSIHFFTRHQIGANSFDSEQLGRIESFLSTFTPSNSLIFAHTFVIKIYLGLAINENDDEILTQIKDAAREYRSIWLIFLSALKASRLPKSRIQALLIKAYLELGALHTESRNAIEQIREIFQSRRSDLDSTVAWDRLALPLPYPQTPLLAPGKGELPLNPIDIRSVELRDIGCLHNLSLQLTPPDLGKGQWTIILGPNGIGKTTILRCIALALRNVNDIGIWPSNVFANPWQRIGGVDDPISADSSISILLGDGRDFKTTIRSIDSRSVTQLPAFSRPRLFPLFAYGCRRGSALGGSARQVNLADAGGPEIATLFDEGAALIHAETWLIQLDGDAQKNIISKSIFQRIIEALKHLLNLDSIVIVDRKVWVTEANHPRLPFSALSDGYLTSAGWFMDLLAHWIAMAEKSKQPIGDDFLSTMQGLVLIDEIDLHLHPVWQIEIISRTRKILPKMSFIVTTHNPLTLVGAKAGEIIVLSSDRARVTQFNPNETPMLLSGGQLYRRYFGIEDIYPDGLGRSLQRYGFLSGYALRLESEELELKKLKQQLEAAGLDPGWEIVPRIESQDKAKEVFKPKVSRASKKRNIV
jgi:hypothetical protein